MASLLFSRLVGLYLFRRLALAKIHERSGEHPEPSGNVDERFDFWATARQLFGFGGWFTIGSIFGFVLNQSEKIALGVIVSASAISAFAIPFEVILQSLAIATAISTIAFPQLSALIERNPQKVLGIFNKWLLKTLAVMLVIAVLMLVTIPFVFPFWLRDSLPPHAVLIGQILCLGVLGRTVNILSFSMIHAFGRADLPTKIQGLEIPIHLAMLTPLIYYYGALGAAIGWVIRMFLDGSMLYLCLVRLAKDRLGMADEHAHLETIESRVADSSGKSAGGMRCNQHSSGDQVNGSQVTQETEAKSRLISGEVS
jgi:O-antigen/teichoic acid export membrane protein